MLDSLPATGNYTLVVLLRSRRRIAVPGLGWLCLKKGYYAYTGSAFGKGATSLRRRVARHLALRKTRHWHIDYILAGKKAGITTVVACSSSTNIECRIAKDIQSIEGATIPIKGFGASDCRQNCQSHLAYFGGVNVQDIIVDIYRSSAGHVRVLRINSA